MIKENNSNPALCGKCTLSFGRGACNSCVTFATIQKEKQEKENPADEKKAKAKKAEAAKKAVLGKAAEKPAEVKKAGKEVKKEGK